MAQFTFMLLIEFHKVNLKRIIPKIDLSSPKKGMGKTKGFPLPISNLTKVRVKNFNYKLTHSNRRKKSLGSPWILYRQKVGS